MPEPTYKDLFYVRCECERLAKQLAVMGPSNLAPVDEIVWDNPILASGAEERTGN